MKRFLSAVLRIKIQACILFAASVVIALAVSLFLPDWSLTETILWQDMLICFVGSFLQWLSYSPDVFKSLRYGVRHLVFAPVFLAFLSVCAYFFHWFPVEYFTAWLLFAGIFLVMFFIISLVFRIYYKMTGKKYDDALLNFKQGEEK